MAMESIRLWLALTPKQFDDLNNGKEIQPDEYSKRFGIRKDPIAAVERAQYFNDWTPEGPKGEFEIFDPFASWVVTLSSGKDDRKLQCKIQNAVQRAVKLRLEWICSFEMSWEFLLTRSLSL